MRLTASTITSGKGSDRRGEAAFTLMEMVIATGIGAVLTSAVIVSFLALSSAFNSVGNYADLDRQSRNALGIISRDIRQTGALTNWSSTNLSFTNKDGQLLSYTYSPSTWILTYTNASTASSGVLLSNCASMAFSIFQRTPTNGPVSFYAASNAQSAKGILLTFTCLRTNSLGLTNSETIQTASVIMRNN